MPNNLTILVLSGPDDEQLEWMSVNWPHPRDEMIAKTSAVIREASDYNDAIEKLKLAGFKIEFKN